jgi:hypothetical protein
LLGDYILIENSSHLIKQFLKYSLSGWRLTSAFHDGRSKEILQRNEETGIKKTSETGAKTEGLY